MAGNIIKSDSAAVGGIPQGDMYDDGTDLWVMTKNGLEKITDRGTLNIPSLTASDITLDEESAATTGNIAVSEMLLETTGASSTNTVELARFVLSSEVENGDWTNAILGKIDLGATGSVNGLAGVICAELDLPTTPPATGHYSCFEAELNVPGDAGLGVGNGTSFMIMNAWGEDVATFQTSGYVFELTGLGTPASSHIIQANTDQPTHGLRVLIDGTDYFLLMTTVDNGSES